MAEFTDDDRKILIQIRQILVGNGSKGLCERFDNCQEEERDFHKDYYTFKRNTLIFMAVAVTGTGGLGYGIARLLLGG